MNRVILVAAAAAEMAAKVKEVVDAAAAAGVKTAVERLITYNHIVKFN